MTDSEQPSPQSPPSEEQPVPATGPSPATVRLRAARESFTHDYKSGLPRTAQGAVIIDPVQNQFDAELDNMRLSALATCLVNAGIISAEDLSNETARLLEERNEQLNQVIVATRLRGKLNGHRG